jgi:branched-chain amino acid transport system substrate-binding protein
MSRYTAGLAAMAILALAGCGGSESQGGSGGAAKTLTIYSSTPLQGGNRVPAQAMVNAVKLALGQRHYRVGRFKLRFKPLDDSTAQAGNWDPGQVSANARKAALDSSAIAYIGEYNSGATAVSLPILNPVSMPQLSVNTAVGLFNNGPGAAPGEPDKYYPTGKRTLISAVPPNSVEASVIAKVLPQDGCTGAYLLNDEEVYGKGMAQSIVAAAKSANLKILGNGGVDPHSPNYRSLAAKLKSAGVRCVVWAGCTAGNAVQVFKDLSAALPAGKLYASDCTTDSQFFDPKQGGIPARVGRQVTVFSPTLPPDQYPPEGRKFFADYQKQFGDSSPDPYAIYTFADMQLLLDAIAKAGTKGGDRKAVLKNLFATKDKKTLLGTLSVKPDGTTTIGTYGVYAIANGTLKFKRTVSAG